MKIDAIIPFHLKDSSTIQWCVQGIRNHLAVNRIVIVCRKDCQPLVESLGAVFFDEDRVIDGLTAKSVPDKHWGWYFQQILKLGMAEWVDTQHYLVVDADTVFLRPVKFFDSKYRPLYVPATEFHKPYFDVFSRLLAFDAYREYSFIAHHMVFDCANVRELTSLIGKRKPWHQEIMKLVEPQAPWFSGSQFSEYETYGHFLKAVHPDQFRVRPLRWANLNALPNKKLVRRLGRKFHFCSFHEHYRRNNPALFERLWNHMRLETKLLTAPPIL